MSLQAVSEDVDYELIPCDDVANEQAWDVRILRGDFIESVIRFALRNREQGYLTAQSNMSSDLALPYR